MVFEDSKDGKPVDPNQSFLRVARSGNLAKVLDFLNSGIKIDTSNANGLNALHLASKEGHTPVVRELLMRNADPDACTKKGNTALHIASLAGQIEVVKLLIEKGAKVNCQSQNGFTPLYMAAQENHIDVVKFLLASGASQTLATTDGFTPLAVALQQGHDKVVAILLENDSRGRSRMPALHVAAKKDDLRSATLLLTSDSDPNHQAGSGFTALHIAAHYGSLSVASLLIEKGADVNFQARNNITPLHVAAKWGMLPVVQKLIEHGSEVDCKTRDGLTPLHCAARSGQYAVADLLLGSGASFGLKSRSGLSPLHMATQGDHVDCARLLLVRGANLDDTTVDLLTPLHVAAHCGYTRVAKLLLDHRCMVNARALNGFTPLHIACKKNRIRVIELLLQYGCAIEATTESGLTPLHVAAFMGHTNVVVLLLQNSAVANCPTVRCETPLHLAVRSNQPDTVRVLLRNGAQVDARAKDNQTPLHIASRLGSAEVTGLLLQAGANPDAVCKDNYTALHVAAREGHEEVATLLLDSKASMQLTTKKGATALHNAAKYDKLAVAKLLLSRGADPNARGRNGLTPLHLAAHYNRCAVANALLEAKASPGCVASNGYTPLHIAARKNHIDLANQLLSNGANAKAESKSGFAPLHLASQEGHADMCNLLLQRGAPVDQTSHNGITPLHLAAQEDKVASAEVLVVQHGGQVDPQTKAGYTPLHTACFFNQTHMIRFLIDHGANVNAQTLQRFTSLHVASQQGHLQVVYTLLEAGADPNLRNVHNWTPAHIAKKQNYISIFEALRQVTTTIVNWEEEIILEETIEISRPDTVAEHHMSDSDDDGARDEEQQKEEEEQMLRQQRQHDEEFSRLMASPLFARPLSAQSGDAGSLDETSHDIEKIGTLSSQKDTVNMEHIEPTSYMSQYKEPETLTPPENYITGKDNVPTQRIPVVSGFLVSFLVDARGGAMNGSRYPGLRIVIPPNAATAPTRVTCRLMRQGRVSRPPQLNDGEGLACRIIEMGPAGAKFNSQVLLEIPHFASLRDKEREIVIYKSENGDTWKEHTVDVNDQTVQSAIGGFFGNLESNEELRKKRVVRILTDSFPQYFALVTRIRQESSLIGPEGGVISSNVISAVQAVFPEGALTKKIRVGIQAQPVGNELVTKLLGSRVAVSPVVTIEPRRRKFHKPITLTIPLPRPATRGVTSPGESPTLRLLCSITGGTQPATWEDITGSTPLSYVKDCVSFTTTVSARFWLMDCPNTSESADMASRLYRDSFVVPYMGRFAIFAKRTEPEEGKLRCFCVTDDKVDKTLECNEGFELKAQSREFEVLDGKPQWIEGVGNLVPVTKSGEQFFLPFKAFRENRLAFSVRLKDPSQTPIGKVAFLKDPRPTKPTDSPSLKPICTLEIELPEFKADEANKRPASRQQQRQQQQQQPEPLSFANDSIARSELDLRDIAECVRSDWALLAKELGLAPSDVAGVKVTFRDERERALAALCQWQREAGPKATGNELERALRRIGRDDVIKRCMKNVKYVVEEDERRQAESLIDDEKANDEIVPVVDEAHPQRPAKTPEELEADKKAKTEAFLGLIDALDTLEGEPEVRRRESDPGDKEPIDEEIAVESKGGEEKKGDIEDLLTKMDELPAQSMAPEADTPEEELNVPQSAGESRCQPSKGDETPPPTPIEGLPEEKKDEEDGLKEQARQLVEEYIKREEEQEDASAEQKEKDKEEEKKKEEKEEGKEEEKKKEEAPESGKPDDDDEHQHSVTHRHELVHGEPQETVEVEEFEEEMPDGSVVKKKVVRRRIVQDVLERVVVEGCADEVQRIRDTPEVCLGHHPDGADNDEDEEVVVEETEETLPDGSVVKRRVVTRRSCDVTVLHSERDEPEQEEKEEEKEGLQTMATEIVAEAIRAAIEAPK